MSTTPTPTPPLGETPGVPLSTGPALSTPKPGTAGTPATPAETPSA